MICIAGKNQLAIRGLRHILDSYPDHDVCCLPNRGDLGMDGWQPSFARQAQAWGVRQVSLGELYEEENLILICLEFDTLIKTTRFKSRKLFNFHFSKLPKYKGMFTAAHPILAGESHTGVTLHLMDDGIDTGDIIDQCDVEIDIDDTVRDLYFKNLQAAAALFDANVARLVSGEFKARPQNVIGSTYNSKHSIDYANLHIDLNRTAFEVHNQFRAFTFREFQLPTFEGWSIARTALSNDRSTLRPGRLVSENDEAFRIATIDFDLLLYKDFYSVLWAACEVGNLSTALSAMSRIDDIDLRNSKGWTALILAAYHGHTEVVAALLERGADPDLGNYKGTTPLMYAVSRYETSRDDGAFRTIAAHAKRTDAVDYTGKTLVDWINVKGFKELLAFLG